MHEMALCTNVVDTVLNVANEASAVSVDKVAMTIGEMRDVVVDMFESFFRYLTRDTIAENAEIEFTVVPFLVQCGQCGSVFHPGAMQKERPCCPECGASEYSLHSGNEFFIESIDVTTEEEARAAF